MLIESININTFKTDQTPAGQPENKMAGKNEESRNTENEKIREARQEQQEEEGKPTLAEKVADVQKSLDIVQDTELQFSIHEATGEEIIIVSDKSSGELIREIPSEEFLDLAAKIDQMVGLIFDITA